MYVTGAELLKSYRKILQNNKKLRIVNGKQEKQHKNRITWRDGGSGCIHFGEVIHFIHALGSEWLQSVHPKLFLFFLSVSVQCALWSITTTDMSCHLCPARLKCSATGSWICFVLLVDRLLLILKDRWYKQTFFQNHEDNN
jgi:hypothetical protein